MKWFKKAINKQEKIYFDFYYYVKRNPNDKKVEIITLDRIALSSKIHINELKHRQMLLVIYEY